VTVTFSDQVRSLVQRQGSTAEDDLLFQPLTSYSQHQTANPGARPAATFHVVLAGTIEAFHKPFSRVDVALAHAYRQHRREPPIHECAAWRLARSLGGEVEEIVAPTVMRHLHGEWGSLASRWYGDAATIKPMLQRPDQCLAAAFFDSLIAQQDRHLGNIRWDDGKQHLGLFDHGYAFADPGATLNESAFVAWRWQQGKEALGQWEHDALIDLLGSHDLHGMTEFLQSRRANALEDRARRMLQSGRILVLGDF